MADIAKIVQNMLRDELIDYHRAEAISTAVENAIRKQIAGRIHAVELHIQYMLEEDPINARLNGALSALQQARDIAEGKNLV